MKRKFLIFAAAVLMTVPALANDSVNNDGELSPVFLRSSAPAPAAVDMQAWNSATTLPTDHRAFELQSKMAYGLAQEEGSQTATSDATATVADKKNPGRALLLSAILPGAGELYAGSRIKAAFFFAVEMACWYGAVSTALDGNNKETDYQNFVEDHYREDYYRAVEYAAAQDPNYPSGGEAFTGTSSEWMNLSWQERINYLPNNFTHELDTEHDQSYYENVGKYLTQFGFGWNDWINGRTTNEINSWAAANGYNWVEGGGTSAMVDQYIDMRYQSNQLLDKSAMFFSIIMVNHVVSALDAGFTVRFHNRKYAKVEPNAAQIWHNNESVTMAGLNVRF